MKYVLCRIDLSKGQSEVFKEFNRLHTKYGAHEAYDNLAEIQNKLKKSDEIAIDRLSNMADTEKKEVIKKAIQLASDGYSVDIDGIVNIDNKTAKLLQLISNSLDFSSLSETRHSSGMGDLDDIDFNEPEELVDIGLCF